MTVKPFYGRWHQLDAHQRHYLDSSRKKQNNSKPKRREAGAKWTLSPLCCLSSLTGPGHSNNRMFVVKTFVIAREITRAFLLSLLFVFCSLCYCVAVGYSGRNFWEPRAVNSFQQPTVDQDRATQTSPNTRNLFLSDFLLPGTFSFISSFFS